jgi:hypothetical protein
MAKETVPEPQVGTGWQLPPEQIPLPQSLAELQPRPTPQLAPQDPPQSVSLSLPFWIPSEQVGPEGVWQVPPEQRPLAQSLPELQPCPLPQLAPQEPPQSTAVSLPFLIPSEHVGPDGAWQVPF